MDQFQQNLLTQGFSAFAGAFFAFIFLRLATFFSKLYQRQVDHYNSLVLLESQLNEIGGIIHDNLYLIPDFRQVITSGNIYFNNLHKIPIDKSHYINLYNLDLINDLFSYNYQLRKLNDDIETISLGYQDIKNALIEKNITAEHYKINAESLAGKLKIIEIFLTEQEKETIRLLARIRVQIRKDMPLGTRLMRLVSPLKDEKPSQQEIDNEIEKLNKEIGETKTTSQKQIEEILKKYQ